MSAVRVAVLWVLGALGTVTRRVRVPSVDSHPTWCDRARCERDDERDGARVTFHRAYLLDAPGPLRVELYRTVTTSRWGRAVDVEELLYADAPFGTGVSAGDAALLGDAITRAAALMVGPR